MRRTVSKSNLASQTLVRYAGRESGTAIFTSLRSSVHSIRKPHPLQGKYIYTVGTNMYVLYYANREVWLWVGTDPSEVKIAVLFISLLFEHMHVHTISHFYARSVLTELKSTVFLGQISV